VERVVVEVVVGVAVEAEVEAEVGERKTRERKVTLRGRVRKS
jgi:hypothetical protein